MQYTCALLKTYPIGNCYQLYVSLYFIIIVSQGLLSLLKLENVGKAGFQKCHFHYHWQLKYRKDSKNYPVLDSTLLECFLENSIVQYILFDS